MEGRGMMIRYKGSSVFFFQAEDGIRDIGVTGVQTCALPIYPGNKPGIGPCGCDQMLAMNSSLYIRTWSKNWDKNIWHELFFIHAQKLMPSVLKLI